MPTLRETPLRNVAAPVTATFADAARALRDAGLAAIAVVDDERRVIGLFTEDDLVQGLFPAYLRELRHTAFLEDQPNTLAARLKKVAHEPVTKHMQKPVKLEIETSVTHAAERFLHCEWGALAVVERGRFVGMLSQVEFGRAMCERLGLP